MNSNGLIAKLFLLLCYQFTFPTSFYLSHSQLLLISKLFITIDIIGDCNILFSFIDSNIFRSWVSCQRCFIAVVIIYQKGLFTGRNQLFLCFHTRVGYVFKCKFFGSRSLFSRVRIHPLIQASFFTLTSNEVLIEAISGIWSYWSLNKTFVNFLLLLDLLVRMNSLGLDIFLPSFIFDFHSRLFSIRKEIILSVSWIFCLCCKIVLLRNDLAILLLDCRLHDIKLILIFIGNS